MSAPGAPAAQEGITQNVDLFGHNPITQTVDSRTRTIVNRTEPGHEFFDGSVIITAIPQPNNGSLISIRGTGTNGSPVWNTVVG